MNNNNMNTNQNIIINRIAPNYLQHAQIQRISAQKIYTHFCSHLTHLHHLHHLHHLQKSSEHNSPQCNNFIQDNHFTKDITILDLGSGSGTLSHCIHDIKTIMPQSTTTILCDLNIEMLKTATKLSYPNQNTQSTYINQSTQGNQNTHGTQDKQDKQKNHGNSNFVNADSHSLPFADNSFDIIISNLMIQWSTSKSTIIQEIKRILKPNGQFICTTLLDESLWQLQQTWVKILGNNNTRTLKFEHLDYYKEICAQNELNVQHSEFWEHTEYFNTTLDLMRHFKNTGTNIALPHGSGLGGKQRLQEFNQIYESMRTESGLPLCYKYGLFIATYK